MNSSNSFWNCPGQAFGLMVGGVCLGVALAAVYQYDSLSDSASACLRLCEPASLCFNSATRLSACLPVHKLVGQFGSSSDIASNK